MRQAIAFVLLCLSLVACEYNPRQEHSRRPTITYYRQSAGARDSAELIVIFYNTRSLFNDQTCVCQNEPRPLKQAEAIRVAYSLCMNDPTLPVPEELQ